MFVSLHGYWVKQIHSTTSYPMINMGPFLILIVLTGTASTMKVFSFNSSEGDVQLSSAVLSNSPSSALPENFIVCFAMKQDKIDRSSPFLIRDRNSYPWIAPSIWNMGSIFLWFDLNKGEWLKFQEIEKPWKFCALRSTPSPGRSRCLWTAARPWLEDQRNWGKRTNQRGQDHWHSVTRKL